MENVIILILFTYPGAFSEFVYHHLAADKSFFRKPDEVFRVARDFFVSAFITLCSLAVINWFGGTGYSLPELVKAMPRGYLLWIYSIISLIFSGIVGIVWYWAARMIFHLKVARQMEVRGTEESIRATTWDDFLNMKNVPYEDCIVSIYKNGQLVRAGIAKNITLNPSEDPGITLMYCSTVEGDLIRPREERACVDDALVHYYDLKTGTDIAIHDGKAMAEYIKNYQEPD